MALEGEIELAVSDSIIRETLGILRDKFKTQGVGALHRREQPQNVR
jgi:hypothetical protein